MLWPFHVYHSSVQAAAAAKKKENTIPYQLNEINVDESVGSNDRVRHLALPFVAASGMWMCAFGRVCVFLRLLDRSTMPVSLLKNQFSPS